MRYIDMRGDLPMCRRTHARVRYSAAYPTGAERRLEPRYGCALAPLIGIRFADGLSAGGYAGVGLLERCEPEGTVRGRARAVCGKPARTVR